MKTLVFGGNGFIGSSIAGDIRITREEVDILNYESVEECLRKYQPEHVISAAAMHGSFQSMQSNHALYLRNNFIIDSNILEASRQQNISRVTILSSISGLPESNKSCTEADLSTGAVSELNFGYNFSKFASTQLVHAYQKDGFQNYRSFLLGNIYGYNDKFNNNSNVVATLIKLMYKAKMENTDLELYGNGLDSRCFTYLGDVQEIVTRLSRKDDLESLPIIISNSENHTIVEISKAIALSMEFNNRIVFKGNKDDGFTEKKVDNSRLMKILEKFEFTTLDEGINLTVQGYLQSMSS